MNYKAILFVMLLVCGGVTVGCTDTQGSDATDMDSDTVDLDDSAPDSDSEDEAPVGWMDVPADNEHILYTGRIDFSDAAAPTFAFPGISIRMKFTGRGVGMRLVDSGSAFTTNYYGVVIDDGDLVEIEVSSDVEEYELATDLEDGEHTVEVFKLGEAAPAGAVGLGIGTFLGFRLDDAGEVLSLEPRPYKVEFIGDSITCGYGNEDSISFEEISNNPSQYVYTTEDSNAWLAWGAVASRMLDADYMAVAYSGKGITRNFGGGAGAVIPELYTTVFPNDPERAAWDTADYTPDVLVINLGTNDFSDGLDPVTELDAMRADYRSAYVTFLETLRGYYPDTAFIVAVGPMISDYYPVGYDAWTNIQLDVTEVVDTVNQAGDANVYLHIMEPQTEPYGEDYHPTAATHERMAQSLVTFINDQGLLD